MNIFSGMPRVFVAGHEGMLGSALVRRLSTENCVLTRHFDLDRLDLRRQADVEDYFRAQRPSAVFIAAGTIGGISANMNAPVPYLYDNLMIVTNLLNASFRFGVEKVINLGSSCMYPRGAEIPIKESALATSLPDPSNQWHATAKIAGTMLARAYAEQYSVPFVTAVPASLFGANDTFDLSNGHVIPSLIAKMHLAKQRGASKLVLWGTGTARREFLNVDDCADALVFLAKTYDGPKHINVGTGEEISIADLAQEIANTVGFGGDIEFDGDSKYDGPPSKLLDSSMIRSLGWLPREDFRLTLSAMYSEYLVSGGHRRTRDRN